VCPKLHAGRGKNTFKRNSYSSFLSALATADRNIHLHRELFVEAAAVHLQQYTSALLDARLRLRKLLKQQDRVMYNAFHGLEELHQAMQVGLALLSFSRPRQADMYTVTCQAGAPAAVPPASLLACYISTHL
jgi:hypothetical protein